MRASLVLATLLAACATSTAPVDIGDAGSGNTCTPGSTKTCICLGGGAGVQTCRTSGTSYGNCTGCAGQPDGMVTVQQDAGGSPCGDCNGCCNDTTCVPLDSESNSQCGPRGSSCQSCGTRVCDPGSGACVDSSGSCNSSSCSNGCCGLVNGSPTCFVNQPAECGNSAGACTTCTYGVTCNGACTNQIDSNAQFKVVVHSTDFYNTDANGNCWDNYAGVGCADADPEVCFGYESNGTFVEGCTQVVNDTPPGSDGNDHPTWDDTTGLVTVNGSPLYVPGSIIIAGGKLRISVYDHDDFNSNDTIAQGYLTPVSTLSDPMGVGAYGRVIHISYSLR